MKRFIMKRPIRKVKPWQFQKRMKCFNEIRLNFAAGQNNPLRDRISISKKSQTMNIPEGNIFFLMEDPNRQITFRDKTQQIQNPLLITSNTMQVAKMRKKNTPTKTNFLFQLIYLISLSSAIARYEVQAKKRRCINPKTNPNAKRPIQTSFQKNPSAPIRQEKPAVAIMMLIKASFRIVPQRVTRGVLFFSSFIIVRAWLLILSNKMRVKIIIRKTIAGKKKVKCFQQQLITLPSNSILVLVIRPSLITYQMQNFTFRQ